MADTPQQLLDEGKADAVAYGKLYIANPDLVERFAKSEPLNTPDPTPSTPTVRGLHRLSCSSI